MINKKENIRLRKDNPVGNLVIEVLADPPVGGLVIKKSGDFCL